MYSRQKTLKPENSNSYFINELDSQKSNAEILIGTPKHCTMDLSKAREHLDMTKLKNGLIME
jgi:hypothetical protein